MCVPPGIFWRLAHGCECVHTCPVVAAGTLHSHAPHVLGQLHWRFTLCSVAVVTESVRTRMCVRAHVCVRKRSDKGPCYLKKTALSAFPFYCLIFIFHCSHSHFLLIFLFLQSFTSVLYHILFSWTQYCWFVFFLMAVLWHCTRSLLPLTASPLSTFAQTEQLTNTIN